MAKQPSSRASRSWTRRPPPLSAPAVRCGISLRKKGNRRHPGNPDRQPGQATTSATHRVPSHAGPSPRAAGAPIGVGLGSSPGLSVLLPPQRIAGSYPSFQPPGGLAPGVPGGHHGAPGPASLPHDRRVRSPSPGQSHPVEVAGNSPVYSHGCKCPHLVAERVAGKPGCTTLGRILYISYSSTPCSCVLTGPGAPPPFTPLPAPGNTIPETILISTLRKIQEK